MSITSKSFIALGFIEGLAGVFASMVTGDAAPGAVGTQLGALTMTAGILLDSNGNSAPSPVS